MTELWKAISGFPGYEVSNIGRVRSIDRLVRVMQNGTPSVRRYRGRVLKQTRVRAYWQIVLCKEEENKTCLVHRLVARAFLPKPTRGRDNVRHKDDDGGNNKIGNLEWGSQQDNIDDKVKRGRHPRGEDSARASMTATEVKRIKKMLSSGARICDISDLVGIPRQTIQNIKRGDTWVHV
jgi:hypothetical protein